MIRFAISIRNDDDRDYQEGDHWINSDDDHDDHDVMTHNDDDHRSYLCPGLPGSFSLRRHRSLELDRQPGVFAEDGDGDGQDQYYPYVDEESSLKIMIMMTVGMIILMVTIIIYTEILKVVNAVLLFYYFIIIFGSSCAQTVWAINTAVLSFGRLALCTVLIAQLCLVLGR